MSKYYNPHRQRNLFDPADSKPFRLSRTRLDLFLSCPRCFYFDRRLGTDRPPGFPFALNSAVDALLKKEFDLHRAKKTPHPLMKKYGVDAVPFAHPELDAWRDSLRRGIRFHHQPTNFMVTGGVDDVWVKPDGELIIVDYKATSKDEEITMDDEWKDGYKRQMEIYQWLFRQNGFRVSETGYFLYCNASTAYNAFDGKLNFEVTLLPYHGSDGWIEKSLIAAKSCLMSEKIPASGEDCDFCQYVYALAEAKNLVEHPKENPQTSLSF